MSARDEMRAARRASRRAARPGKAERKRALATEALPSVSPAEPATPAARGFETCPCSKDCTLHGKCLLCVAYHGRSGKRPRCE